MPEGLRREATNKEVVDAVKRVIADNMFAVWERSLQKKLTWQYLGIQSDTLRPGTHAITDKSTVYVGTIPWYGHAYETGNWKRWKGREGNKKKYKRNRKATWAGEKKHRPFMSDTIKDKKNLAQIARRVKTRLKNEIL